MCGRTVAWGPPSFRASACRCKRCRDGKQMVKAPAMLYGDQSTSVLGISLFTSSSRSLFFFLDRIGGGADGTIIRMLTWLTCMTTCYAPRLGSPKLPPVSNIYLPSFSLSLSAASSWCSPFFSGRSMACAMSCVPTLSVFPLRGLSCHPCCTPLLGSSFLLLYQVYLSFSLSCFLFSEPSVLNSGWSW